MNKKLIWIMCGAIASAALPVFALPATKPVDKEENVYVISDTSGEVDKVIVSGWLKNPQKLATLTDVTDLINLMNVKGNETFTSRSGNTKIWAANGNDIFYQGISQKQVPVSIKISYSLNGRTVSAEDLAGKSGHVVIRFDYSTNIKETVVVDGKRVQLSPAFLVMSGILLDNENFRNITVSNGKIINDGNRSIVLGIGFPGLQENLGLNSNEFQFPSSVEIGADVQDFSLITMMSIASNELIGSLNLDSFHAGDDLSQLVEDLSGELNRGLVQLTNGVSQLNDGAHQINDGMQQLNEGLATLNENSPVLVDGAMQVFQALLATANSTLASKHVKIEPLTVENYHQVLEPLAEKLILQKDKKQILDLIESLDNYKTFYEGIVTYTNGVGQCYEGSSQLAAGTQTLSAGTDTLTDAVYAIKHGSAQLVEGVSSFQDDSLSILDGMDGFDRETLKKLMAAISESEVVLPRLKATVEVTKKYQSFTGLAPNSTGKVRFIYRTNSI